jgi:hypothetical protein
MLVIFKIYYGSLIVDLIIEANFYFLLKKILYSEY